MVVEFANTAHRVIDRASESTRSLFPRLLSPQALLCLPTGIFGLEILVLSLHSRLEATDLTRPLFLLSYTHGVCVLDSYVAISGCRLSSHTGWALTRA